ncbi:MAG: DUF6968 family protein [Phreatobacter sp.]|uniref:DUF6968 family protein n=1 Tax=Phreatobacter sp. TaxID=1966341 RepID=UPI0040368931
MLIGMRVLTLRTDTGDVPVAVRLFQPIDEEDAWRCRYEIGWPDALRESAAWGADALQALHLAMQKIAVDLYGSDAHREGRLSWPGQGAGYGFPMPKSGRDLLVGCDKEFDG